MFYNPERDQFVVTALNENYKLMFSYKDKNGESLGCVWITPEDYKRVIGNNGRNIVEKNVLMELLDEYNKIIPCEYFGGTELMSVELNYVCTEERYQKGQMKWEPEEPEIKWPTSTGS